MQGRNDAFKESVIAVEVFDRPPDYDPKLDSTVRVEMGRLRSRLIEYYSSLGSNDAVRIEIPKGVYEPAFVFASPVREPAEAAPGSAHVWKLAVAALAIFALAATAFFAWKRLANRAAPASIAVLPFLNLSGDPKNEYLSDSLTDELTEALSESKSLRVVARTSAFQFKGKNQDVRDIGQRLNAGAVLEGSLIKQPDRFSIVVQLIRASDGFHLWSHTYNATAADLPRMPGEIARAAMEELNAGEKIEIQEPRTTSNPEAHELYMRANYLYHQRTPDALRESLSLAREAAAKDPTYAAAYYVIVRDDLEMNTYGLLTFDDAVRDANPAIEKALALNPNYSGVHAYRAVIAYIHDWDWPQAERDFELALRQGSPSNARNLYGWALMTRGRFDEALRQYQIADELDPLYTGVALNRTTLWILRRRYGQATHEAKRVLEMSPKSSPGIAFLSYAELLENDCAAARSGYEKAAGLYPGLPGLQVAIALTEAWCGNQAGARARLAQALAQKDHGLLSPYNIAEVYAVLGDRDHAIQFLEESAKRREQTLLYLHFTPDFDPIRNDPRFVSLERRIGLVQ